MGNGRPVGVAGFGTAVIASNCPGLRFTMGMPHMDPESEYDGDHSSSLEYKYGGAIQLFEQELGLQHVNSDGSTVVHDEKYNVFSTGASAATGQAGVALAFEGANALATAVADAVVQGTKATGDPVKFDSSE